ncbi:hypothetical protein D210916BOD24_07400 [Alteromonas sp. D210916BOD_24]|uniref:TonB-dependent receptor plug domain-containing protein n=1 Tax=Alteromonas sp. D210916BOD_24 TaxID=3157618 RepID=UPI00399D0D22
MKTVFLTLFISTVVSASVAYAQQLERYTVTAQRPYYNRTLERLFPQNDYDQSNAVAPLAINDILVRSPSVNLNGQGGQIQNVNIRGFSRWRIQSLLDGVPVISDRRAGTSLGFIPPSFVEQVSVIPGATSTYLGSGAIGGALNVQFATQVKPHVRWGYSSNQSAQQYSYADRYQTLDWQVSHRNSGNGSDANDKPLFDQFEQNALFVRYRPDEAMLKEAWTVYSDNRDVGKSSSDYPESRITVYPNNTHWLGKGTWLLSDVKASLWWHQSQLDTQVVRPNKRINESESRALDFGANLQGQGEFTTWHTNWQLQLMGRSGVITDEREFSLDNGYPETVNNWAWNGNENFPLAYAVRTLDANELNAAGVVDASRSFNATAVALGARVDWQQQSHQQLSVNSENISGFIGANHQFSPQWAVSLYLSSAFRNPSLTERFFSGETPRGTVLGDLKLDTEQAVNLQGTLYYMGDSLKGSLEVFNQQIDNYIERTQISDEVIQYTNLHSATVKGVSYQLNWRAEKGRWDIQLGGAWITGEDESGNVIADIPANKQRLDLGVELGEVRLFSTFAYRASKTDVAEGERSLTEVVTVDAGASWQVNQDLTLQISGRNLTNQQFYVSTDDKAAFAQGKSLQLGLIFAL